MDRNSLSAQLYAELRALRRLRDRIQELRYFLDYQSQGIRTYYAVDFSEIFSYLHREDEDELKAIGVSLDQENTESNALQYRLALTHLFNSFAKPLYILPSHVLEMWSYVKTANIKSGKRVVHEGKPDQLFEGIRGLPSDLKLLLNSLRDKDQSSEASRRLLRFVKSAEFGPLCVDISEFVAWYKRGNVLNTLIQQGILSPRLDDLLTENRIDAAALQEPSQEDISKVVQTFDDLNVIRPPFATKVDSRAFLVLRNLNRVLAKEGTRVVLITRDTQLLRVARILEKDRSFDWGEARRCFRGIESIFLDLTLTNLTSLESKRKWVNESERELKHMHESVQLTLNRLNAASSIPSFTAMGKRVMKETTHLWDQHINVRLSLASKSIPWLGQAFLDISKGGLPEAFTSFRGEYQILENLLEYLSTNTYRDLAVEDVKAIWSGIEIECLRMGFLDRVGAVGAKGISNILTQTLKTPSGHSTTIIHSKRFFRMPSLQLVSKTYQDKLKALRTHDKEEFGRMLVSLIGEVVSGSDEPEDLLVMAFLLGLQEEWSHSLEVISKCRQDVRKLPESSLSEKIIPSEIDYLSSAINRRLAQKEPDDDRALNLYLEAYKDIKRARKAVSDDPRYMVSEAATAMIYREAIKKLRATSKEDDSRFKFDPSVLTEAKVKQQLIMALDLATERNDRRLEIVILNNLAFGEVEADIPHIREAQDYLKRVDEIMRNANRAEELLFSGILPHIQETKVMLQAREARDRGNSEQLVECVKALIYIGEQEDSIESETKIFADHVDIVNRWIDEVRSRPKLPHN